MLSKSVTMNLLTRITTLSSWMIMVLLNTTHSLFHQVLTMPGWWLNSTIRECMFITARLNLLLALWLYILVQEQQLQVLHPMTVFKTKDLSSKLLLLVPTLLLFKLLDGNQVTWKTTLWEYILIVLLTSLKMQILISLQLSRMLL